MNNMYSKKNRWLVLLTFPLCFASELLAQSLVPNDLDRDGIPNHSDLDVDNDRIPNGRDRNIDGGVARSGPLRGRYVGDRLLNHQNAELDMDADGLPDDAPDETDIDGDGFLDSDQRREWDIDADGVANGLDADADGDEISNSNDIDMYGDETPNDIFIGVENAYADDASVQPIIAFVTAELRKTFSIPEQDPGLRVRVQASPFGNWVTGVWRYLSADNIQVYANWAYPVDNPDDFSATAIFTYQGPYSGNPDDDANPAFYVLSEEKRAYAQYPRGPITFVSWLPSEPPSFFYTEPNQQATGLTPPFTALNATLSTYPNFSSDEQSLSFSGDLATNPELTTLEPVINLQRVIMQVTRLGYGRLEARRLR